MYINYNYLYAIDNNTNNILVSNNYGQDWNNITNNLINDTLLFKNICYLTFSNIINTEKTIISSTLFTASSSSGDPHICTLNYEKYTLVRIHKI